MPEWRPFNLAMIPGVPPVLDAVGTAAGTLSGLLDTLAGLLETLAQLVSFMADAMHAAIQALIAIIQELINQIVNLLQTGIYFYLDKGAFFTGSNPDGLHGFLSRWRASFEDQGDSNRPQFEENAQMSAMLFVVGANDLPDLYRLLRLLAMLFGMPSLDWDEDEYGFDIPTRIENSMGTPPDWESVRLGEVCPPFARLAEILMQAMGMLSVTDDYANMLDALAEIISEKAALLAAIADEIQSLVDAITALIESAGLYVLQIDGSGVDDLIAQAETAADVPPWNLESWVAGTCLLAATADFGPVVELLGG
jgi:hypothetical protein